MLSQKKKQEVFKEIVKNQNYILDKFTNNNFFINYFLRKKIGWGDLGNESLIKPINKLKPNYGLLPAYPLSWLEHKTLMKNMTFFEFEKIFDKNSFAYAIYNTGLRKKLKIKNKDELKDSSLFLKYLFDKALN